MTRPPVRSAAYGAPLDIENGAFCQVNQCSRARPPDLIRYFVRVGGGILYGLETPIPPSPIVGAVRHSPPREKWCRGAGRCDCVLVMDAACAAPSTDRGQSTDGLEKNPV